MAIGMPLFVDGFDALSGAGGLASKWDVYTNTSNAFTVTTGRNGGGCIRGNDTATAFELTKNAPSGINRFIVGFALKFRANPGTAQQEVFQVGLVDNTTRYALMYFNSNRTITLARISNAFLYTTPQFPIDGWVYVEMEVFLNATTGIIRLYLDGHKVYEGTGLNTLGSGSALEFIRFVNAVWRQPIDIDDFYLADYTGDTTPTPLGPCRITTFQPTSVDTNTGWTAAGGAADLVDAVDGTFPAEDTEYAEASNVNDILLMASTGVVPTGVGDVRAVAVNARHSKTDGATRALSHVLKSGGTEYTATPDVGLTGSVTASQRVWALDPATAAAWTAANAEAAAFGVKITT